MDLDCRRGYDNKGVVDLLFVRRHKSDPNLLHIPLLEVKGGTARVNEKEIRRLSTAVRRLKVDWNGAEKPKRSVRFRRAMR